MPIPKELARHRAEGPLSFKLPGRQTLALDTLDITLGTLMDIARGVLRDDKITGENFGVEKHFFFVNRSVGTLLNDPTLFCFALGNLGFLRTRASSHRQRERSA